MSRSCRLAPFSAFWVAVLVLVLALTLASSGRADPFAWHDGERVVLIGDTLIEREQRDGYLETLLTLGNPDKAITFRNLGWSGDTVGGIARAGFGKPEDGYRHLVEHVLALRPTVLVVGYGMTDSFDGEAGLARFQQGMNRLLDALGPTGARLILLSPIAHETLGPPLPDPAAHNQSLRRYSDAIRAIARERQARFIDLFTPFLARDSSRSSASAPGKEWEPMTDDGIHLSERGYRLCADLIARELDGPSRHEPAVRFGPGGAVLGAEDVAATDVSVGDRGLRFTLTRRTLPSPEVSSPPPAIGPGRPLLTVQALPAGRYALAIDGHRVALRSAAEWASKTGAVGTGSGPEEDQVEQLRRAIIEKNRLYFYRWRPQNETYLFGFRKHEQGNNAREVPLFDPLVEAAEKEIAVRKVPVSHVYELTRVSEEAK